uniref:Uncharacterized protein n=1 Tax=uncultured prokaryote TaxID=198431 RepID=A0A0H5QK60_9ZZZZ|nr:hypothetical protein [uncultured prokaryote]
MAGPAHVHMVVSGTMAGGEVFAFGFDTAGAAGNQATLDDAVASTAAVLTTSGASQTTFKGLLTGPNSYTAVTGYSYSAGSSSASLVSKTAISVAGAATVANPYQVCVVASLITAVPSRRTRGRMYLPGQGITVSPTSGFFSGPTPQAIATAVGELITAQGVDISPVVISTVGDLATPVVSVRVDNKADTQRRRANKLLPTVFGTQLL